MKRRAILTAQHDEMCVVVIETLGPLMMMMILLKPENRNKKQPQHQTLYQHIITAKELGKLEK